MYEFCLQWALMTLLDPVSSFKNLTYIAYPGDPSSAFRVTRKRCLDRKKQQSERSVFQCFVFGPANAGKSALLNSFLGRYLPEFPFLIANSVFPSFFLKEKNFYFLKCRPYSDSKSSTAEDGYAVSVVELPGVSATMSSDCMLEATPPQNTEMYTFVFFGD